MRIAWFNIPAKGHTNPTLAVAEALTRAGHVLYYFSFAQFKEEIEKTGATFIGCDDYAPEMEDMGDADRVGKDLGYATELMVASTLALDELIEEELERLRPNLIVSDSAALWGKLAAIRHEIPYVCSTTTFAFNKESASYLKHGAKDAAKLMLAMPKINRQLKRLQKAGYPINNLLDILQSDNDTNTIVYTSRLFQPYADSFSDRYCFAGPIVRRITAPVQKKAEVTVFVSFGTVNRAEALYEACVEAMKDTGYQVIIATGANAVRFDDLPPLFEVHETVDQMAVLSVSDVFISHCGMNSASEGLYFEVPLVLCPQTAEQRAVAERVEELSAGLFPESEEAEDILSAVQEILGDPSYQRAAREIARSFKECGGAEQIRVFLEQVIRSNI